MKKFKKTVSAITLALCAALLPSCSKQAASPGGNTGETVLEEGDVFAVIDIMDYGSVTVKLFPNEAPLAVEKFIRLAQSDYYTGRVFHRVVKDQLIQGGSLTGTGYDGNVDKNEYFPIETSKYMCHYYGAVCMAKNDSGNYCQFYIVNNSEPVDIDAIAENIKADLADESKAAGMLDEDKEYYSDYSNKLSSMPDEVKERYAQVGGIYDLDGEDTVFGQVVDGWDVLKAINEIETVSGNTADDKSGIASKPLSDIVINSVTVVKIAPEETTTEEKTRPARTTTAETTVSETSDNIIINGIEELTTAEETPQESDTDASDTSSDVSEDTLEDTA